MVDYSKLNTLTWLQQVPRVLSPEVEKICDEISGKPAFFVFWGGGKKGWVRDMENARLSFVYVVQANSCLFDAAESQFAPAVILSTTDPRANDPKWVEQVFSGLAERLYTPEFAHAQALLADEDSSIDIVLTAQETKLGQFYLKTQYIDPDLLPGRAIPENRVLPALLHGESWSLLPPKLYA